MNENMITVSNLSKYLTEGECIIVEDEKSPGTVLATVTKREDEIVCSTEFFDDDILNSEIKCIFATMNGNIGVSI